MRQLYTLGIRLYGLALWLAAAFRPKARMWVQGRRGWREQLREALPPHTAPRFWFHCASLGEFEQGRNLIDLLRQHYPQGQIIVTFFSPSGYEIRKNYPAADYVCYLPLDTPRNAADFVRILRPDIAFFVKYELWIHTLAALRKAQIPILLISARVGENSSFLRSPLRELYKEAFAGFRAVFTQDEDSARLIRDFSGNERVFVSYDTRYDRVAANRSAFTEMPEIANFVQGRMCIVAGSTWPADEALLLETFTHLAPEHDLCLIIAPHEIHPEAIGEMCRRFPGISLRYSERVQASGRERMLWIDNIGMLSRLYAYGDIAYVGGAFGKGLHNVLEPAAFGKPVFFGPRYGRFPEAVEMFAQGSAFSVSSSVNLTYEIRKLIADPAQRELISRKQSENIQNRSGATRMIADWCKENLL